MTYPNSYSTPIAAPLVGGGNIVAHHIATRQSEIDARIIASGHGAALIELRAAEDARFAAQQLAVASAVATVSVETSAKIEFTPGELDVA